MADELSYQQARTRSLFRALDNDPSILLLGGAVSLPFNADDGLTRRYAERILWPPVSEFAVAATAIGLALAGMRPLVPITTSSFMFYGWAPVVNEAPNIRYLSGGLAHAPVVFHVMAGSRRGGGPQHEHTPQSMLQNVPGLRVFLPGTPADVDAAFHDALTGGDPAVIVDHVLLADMRGEVPDEPGPPAPALLRTGPDVLIVASSLMTQRALAAADSLAGDGIRASVLNVPVVASLPVKRILDIAAGYEAIVCVDESRASGSPSSRIVTELVAARRGIRVALLATADAPAPFAPTLINAMVPSSASIEVSVRELLGG